MCGTSAADGGGGLEAAARAAAARGSEPVRGRRLAVRLLAQLDRGAALAAHSLCLSAAVLPSMRGTVACWTVAVSSVLVATTAVTATTTDDPCSAVLEAADASAVPDEAWLACYVSQASALIGAFSVRGTNHWKNGSNLGFAVSEACVCSCEGTADGVVCNGTIGDQHGGASASDSSSYTLFAWIPDATIASREPSAPVVWKGRQRSLSDSNVENIYYRQDLEWSSGLRSNRTSIGEGALGGDAAFEVISWRARETPSSCGLQSGEAVRCKPGVSPPELCPGRLPCPASGTCPLLGMAAARACAVGPDSLCAKYKLPQQPILDKCNLTRASGDGWR